MCPIRAGKQNAVVSLFAVQVASYPGHGKEAWVGGYSTRYEVAPFLDSCGKKPGLGGKYFMEIISGWLSQVSVLEWASLPLASDEEMKPRKCVTCECIFFLK